MLQPLRHKTIPPVVQFSMVRTGSTLVWNALRHAVPELDVPKRHDLNPLLRSRFSPTKIVSTIRNPLDALCSVLEWQDADPTHEHAVRRLDELVKHGLRDQLAILRRPRTLFLRYERFFEDFDYLFDELDAFLKVSTPAATREAFARDFGIEQVAERSRRLGGFENFSPEDLIHGHHVSPYRGRPGRYREVLEPRTIDWVRSTLGPYFEAFDY